MSKRELMDAFTWPVSRAGHAWVQAVPVSGADLPQRYLIDGSLVIGNTGQELAPIEPTFETIGHWSPSETELDRKSVV